MAKRKKPIIFPKQICVLDIETAEMVNFDKLAATKIAIVGTQVWHRTRNKYLPGIYIAFSPEQVPGMSPIEKLQPYLEEFDGPIIGHNIFDFDLRLLSFMFEIKKIAAKIVDTMAVLHPKNEGCHFGLALDKLGKKNLNKGKLDSGKKAPHLWKTGKYKQLIKYNQRDLELTKGLWELMIKNESLYIRYGYHPEGGESVHADFGSNDLQVLIGKRRQFSQVKLATVYKTGEKLLTYKPFVSPYRKHMEMQELLEDTQAPLESDIVYRWIICDACEVTNFYRASIQPGFSDHEIAKCGSCQRDLAEVRADMGLEHIASVPLLFEDGACQGFIPGPIKKIIRKELREQLKYLKKIASADGCTICNGSIDQDRRSEQFASPINGSPICSPCWTAGYWQMDLK